MALKQPFWGQNGLFNEEALVYDNSGRDVIPKSMQLMAARTGQEYNIRKKRNGAFWEDRYHATAIELNDHLKSLGFKAKSRSITGRKGHYQLREDVSNFGNASLHGPEPATKSDTGRTNAFLWKDIP